MVKLSALAAAAALFVMIAPAAQAQPCGAAAICGLHNPEDVVAIDGGRWAIASRLTGDAPGGFDLIDLRARTARTLAPDVSHPAANSHETPPDPAKMVTHGLALHRGPGGRLELLAIDHGGRQAVERFEVQVRGSSVSLRWLGSVPIPADVQANAVTALPDGLAVTSFGTADDPKMTALLAGRPAGFVAIWSAAQGWRKLPGSEVPGDNGLEAALDGRELYVNAWGSGTLYVLPLRPGARRRTVALGDFHPDNIHRGADGSLVVAGQVGTADSILACSATPCPVGSAVVRLDSRARRVIQRLTIPASGEFGAASVAVPDGSGYWLGSFLSDRLVRVPG